MDLWKAPVGDGHAVLITQVGVVGAEGKAVAGGDVHGGGAVLELARANLRALGVEHERHGHARQSRGLVQVVDDRLVELVEMKEVEGVGRTS